MSAPECPTCDVSLLEGSVSHPPMQLEIRRLWWAPWRMAFYWSCWRCGYARRRK